MLTSNDVILIVLIIVAAITTPIVLRIRRRSHQRFIEEYSEAEVCEHLSSAMALLRSRGHRIIRAGQLRPNMPLEIHLEPTFDPKALAAELELKEPVFVSDRNVLCCREDWCELHPIG